jgi:hypothetical protein
MFVSI